MSVDKVCQGIAGYINKSQGAQNALKKVSKNPALAGAASSFILATTLRPATVMAITPNKDDAKYGACSSISAAVVELVGSYALFKPMNKMIEKSAEQLSNLKGSIYYKNPALLNSYKSVTNRVAKLPLTFATSLLRFSMVYPLSLMLGAMGIVKSSQKKDQQNGKKVSAKA